MDEILDDDFDLPKKEKNAFLKWWEGNRIWFNVIIIGLMVFFFVGTKIWVDAILFRFLLIYMFIINMVYVIFSWVSFIYRLIVKDVNNSKLSFITQSKILWRTLFVFQILLAVLLFINEGGGILAPYIYSHF